MTHSGYTYDHPRPAVTADIALFRHGAKGWEILLVKRARDPFRDRWAIPGGFVDEMEPLEDAAARELKEECGIEGVELWQFRAFGNPGRDPRGHTISIGYLGIAKEGVEPKAGDDAGETRWFPVDALPELAFDHDEIVNAALERLHRIEVT
ncbi:MAG TPA: NUDIX hydrolase [Thermoanaerobaculia bacterium]|nr:NUDIX hydrolase [Thermoanaerobaculia bacterium]